MMRALVFALLFQTAILPPLPPWDGASRRLVVPANDPWITPSEKSGLRETPTYDETVAYLKRLVAAAPQLRMVSLGKSAEGRDIWMVIASTGADALKRKPTLFAQGGIHAGEIDGKDAGLMLLRDMTVRGTKKELLDSVNFLFVPIFNVDGHERTSRFSRPNQRGPEVSGWRTTSQNYNLNRDYMKADTPEMQAMLRALATYAPDLYLDLHVTDGADYQYDITFGFNGEGAHSPAIANWLTTTYRPAVTNGLRQMGHIPGPLVFGIAGDDVTQGIADRPSDPRLSHGYGDARHMATVLLENHSLKPYDQRVLGTYVFLEQSLRTLGANAAALQRATDEDRARKAATVTTSWKRPDGDPPTIEFLGIEAKPHLSAVSGDVRWEYTGKPVTLRIPYFLASQPATTVTRPAAYWVPASWRDVIAKLDLHGIRYERLAAPREVDVEMLRLESPKFDAQAFEGRVRVNATPVAERRRERFPAGSVRVPTDQPLGTLAVLLLEPASPDSVFQWGFVNAVLNPTEYIEPYAIEPMAEKMLADDPKLAEEFRRKLATDEAFRSSATARLRWFYTKTPYYDERARLYPIAREVR
ncbi:MAG TPA: M14 family metallopeptidase [Thermoanaerobaculia bacterium]